MKKTTAVLTITLIAFSLTACNQADSVTPEENTVNQNVPSASAEPADFSTARSWPAEFAEWGIPILRQGIVSGTEDKSMAEGVMTQGVNSVVSLKSVSKADFDGYCDELAAAGFSKSEDSLEGVMLYYDKTIEDGAIKLTLSYSEAGTTIIANNSAAASKQSAADSSTPWPEAVKAIPQFTKGNYKETVEMGGGMYAITYTGIAESDLEQYRGILQQAGFARQEDSDTEGYGKLNGNTAISVGFVLSGDTLQIIVMSAPL